MKKRKTYAVFGLGRYGMAVATELAKNGMEVLAVDACQEVVDEAADFIPLCKCADVTDPEVLERLGIAEFDAVIICMANNLEASVLAITLCKDAGVKQVIAKCGSEMHQKIMLRVGADEVLFPEKESGERLAKNLLSSGFVDIISLSEDVSMIELDVKSDWSGKNLIELNLRKKYGFNIIAIKKGNEVTTQINPEQPLDSDATLIVIADANKLDKLR